MGYRTKIQSNPRTATAYVLLALTSLSAAGCGERDSGDADTHAFPSQPSSSEAGVASNVSGARPMRERSEGEKLYDAFCAGCHGQGGNGTPPLAGAWQRVKLDGTDADLERTADLIRDYEPGSSMPSYGGMLSEEEILAVAAYVLTLHEEGD